MSCQMDAIFDSRFKSKLRRNIIIIIVIIVIIINDINIVCLTYFQNLENIENIVMFLYFGKRTFLNISHVF